MEALQGAPGMMARSGKWPLKNWSLEVMFLYPTAYFCVSSSTTRSTSRKGYLDGKQRWSVVSSGGSVVVAARPLLAPCWQCVTTDSHAHKQGLPMWQHGLNCLDVHHGLEVGPTLFNGNRVCLRFDRHCRAWHVALLLHCDGTAQLLHGCTDRGRGSADQLTGRASLR